MKPPRHVLKRVQKLERRKYHPILHHIHKKHHISKRTLFYIKEYGPHSHIPRTIIKESIKILILASIISSLGGLAFEQIKILFISIVPLVILFPTLNDMIGDYGGIVSSKFSTLLHEGKIKEKWWKNKEIMRLGTQIIMIAMCTATISTGLSFMIAAFAHYTLTLKAMEKIMLIILVDVILLVTTIFLIAMYAGLYFWRKQEDPNNFLIPLTTSIADFGNMIVLALLVKWFF